MIERHSTGCWCSARSISRISRAITRAFETVAARFGKIDGLANIAGGFRWQTIGDGDLAAWTELFRMNLLTAVTATKAALPYPARLAGRDRQCRFGPGQEVRGGNGRLCRLEGRRAAADRKPRRGS